MNMADEPLTDETIARYVQMAQDGCKGDPYVMGVEIQRLRTENAAMRAIVTAVAIPNSTVSGSTEDDGSEWVSCTLCSGFAINNCPNDDENEPVQVLVHDTNCPAVLAVRLIGELST